MTSCTRYNIMWYNIKFASELRQVGGFFLGTPVVFTNKTDRHDITEILLKVALNTINRNHIIRLTIPSTKDAEKMATEMECRNTGLVAI